MIRVLHIVHALARGGGLSNYIMGYYRKIDREKIQFDFIYFRDVDSNFKDEITSLGGRYYKFTEPSFDFKYVKEANDFFSEHDGEYAVLHCHALFSAAMYGNIAKKHGIKNVFFHSQSAGYGYGMLRKLRNFYMIKKGVRVCTHKFAISPETAEFMFGKKAYKNGEVTIINNTLDCESYLFDDNVRASLRKELKINGKFAMGHVGGFAVWKNHDFLIDVFYEVKKQIPDAVLLLMGDDGIASGSTKPAVLQKIKSYGIEDSILFLGVRDDINKLMSVLDVFVFPSVIEGFGRVMVEAQLAGLPCFASENVPDVVDCCALAHHLRLDEGAAKWADEITSFDYSKNDRTVDLKSFADFDINNKCKELQKIYCLME